MSSHRGIVSLSRHRRAGCRAHGAKSFGCCGQVCGVRGNFRVDVFCHRERPLRRIRSLRPDREYSSGTHVRAGLWGAGGDLVKQETPLIPERREPALTSLRGRGFGIREEPELLTSFIAALGDTAASGITFSAGIRQGISPGTLGERAGKPSRRS